MSQKTILVIDDSSTIRRLVDSSLTAAGYRVIAASTAEDGLELLSQAQPDLILLDHQLPGTTGTEVARHVLQIPEAATIPIVVSSTLRKKAYAEYMDLPNVIDLLPKPYTEELLNTTVENALRTAVMVVHSQSEGTAVPEVIQQAGDPHLSGVFDGFRLREVLDFLNNSGKSGQLEVEGPGWRVFFYLSQGRVAGVSASGIEPANLVDRLPESLQNLAPVLKLTLSGRGSSELDGIVELLNRKVVDPRLLRKLLRQQAAMLTWQCFNEELREFRFTRETTLPPLFNRLALDISVLALLIDGAVAADDSELPEDEDDHVYFRRAIRGQNLDRAGVSAQHLKISNLLGERKSAADVAGQVDTDGGEVRRVLWALWKAELVERQLHRQVRQVLAYDTDPVAAGQLRELLAGDAERYYGKVVRDRFSLQLVLRRAQPDAFMFPLTDESAVAIMRELQQQSCTPAHPKWIAIVPAAVEQSAVDEWIEKAGLHVDGILFQPCEKLRFQTLLDQIFEQQATEQSIAPPVEVAGAS